MVSAFEGRAETKTMLPVIEKVHGRPPSARRHRRRDAGCLLPTWDNLVGLSEACRAPGVALHFDGARIWESQPWFGRTLPEIAALADSLYVSFYKGLGGLAGAALLGPEGFVQEARLWRRRLGGTIYRTTAEAVSALLGLRDRLPIVAEAVASAWAFAAELPSYITAQPGVPHTNQFKLYAAGESDVVDERVLTLTENAKLASPCGRRQTNRAGSAPRS